jgi:hypothetical protein
MEDGFEVFTAVSMKTAIFRWQMSENRMVRRIFGRRREEIIG